MVAQTDFARAQLLLVARNAEQIEHPGGTLLDHVRRVAALLATWGADENLQLAGLSHAFYGTDGFAVALMGLDERPVLAEAIGEPAEALVYLYASCDRQAVYPRLLAPGPCTFKDRFTGEISIVPEPDMAAFVELTAANELDLAMVNQAIAGELGSRLFKFLRGARERLSAPAWQTCLDVLAGHGADVQPR